VAQSFNTSLKYIAGKYVQLTKAKVTTTSAQNGIEENPYYPSLLSLSDTFDKFGIINDAYEVDNEKLDQLLPPFVAYAIVPGVGKDFVLVTNQTNKKVSYLYKGHKPQTISKDAFLKQFQNIVWLAKPDEHNEEPDYAKKAKEEKAKQNKKITLYALVAALIIMTFAINLHDTNYLSFTILSLLKFVGIATTIMILIYDIDQNNPFVKNLCSAGGHTNCGAVLNSKASKIMGASWGEIGFYYFGATTLLLMYPAINYSDKFAYLSVANAFAALFIPFSIYYQWRIIKQWCPLCLIVQGVLFSELLWGIENFWTSKPQLLYSLNKLPTNTLPLVICLIAPVVIWNSLRQVLSKAKDARSFEASYKRLQYNPEIFSGLLHQQPKAPDGWQQLGINLGNPYADTTIIKVCNPFCGPCAKAHPELEEILKHNNNVQLKIIFASKNKAEDRNAIVAKHLLSIAAEGNMKHTQHSLDEWYLAPKKEYKSFAAKYPTHHELELQDQHIEAMGAWCKEAEISFTPTIFINGHRLPENYRIEELKNIL